MGTFIRLFGTCLISVGAIPTLVFSDIVYPDFFSPQKGEPFLYMAHDVQEARMSRSAGMCESAPQGHFQNRAGPHKAGPAVLNSA